AGVLAAAGTFSQQAPTQRISPAARVAPTRHTSPSHGPAARKTGRVSSVGTGVTSTSAPNNSVSSTGQNLASPGAPITASPAGATLQAYWTLINTGHYRKAFAMETPHEIAQEPSFVSDKKASQPMINVVSIGQASS